MEKLRAQSDSQRRSAIADSSAAASEARPDWRAGLPSIVTPGFTLRELRIDDAASLLAMLTTEEVARFISPPPTTVDGLRALHRAGPTASAPPAATSASPSCRRASTIAVGLFQLRALDARLRPSCPGMGLRARLVFWGTRRVRSTARGWCSISRSTSSACSASKRARRWPTAAATAPCARSARCRKACCAARSCATASIHDQVLWSILAEDWRLQRMDLQSVIVH